MIRVLYSLVLIALLGACNETDTAAGGGELLVSIRTLDALGQETSRFVQGEQIQIELTISNPGPADARLSFPTSQQFDFRLLDTAGDLIWQWSATMLFAQAFTSLEILAGDMHKGGVIWNQATDFSGKPVPPGDYVLEGYFIDVAAIAGTELIIQ